MLFGSRLNKLATSIRRALSEYAVLGINPPFVADFIEKKYLTGGASSTFSNAITHARAGNATMTDGYGPELVTNGGFDSDSDWTKGTGWSIADGVASSDGSQSSSSALQAVNILTIGKTYVVTFTVVSRSAGSITARAGTNGVGTGRTATGTYTEIITCAGTDDLRMTASNDFVGSIDNVSVREMPVLKWAPHNLLSYSEDFSQWLKGSGGTGITPTVTDNFTSSPFGENTAARVQLDLSGGTTTSDYSYIQVNIANTTNETRAIWMKLNTGISADITLELGSAGGVVTVTDEWALYSVSLNGASFDVGLRGNLNTADSVDLLVWGAHLYRSDLGGMVDNPDRGDSYVPTTSAAKYLPRIGHHVYNGSAWANEGLLAESAEGVNFFTKSNVFKDGPWNETGAVVTPDAAVGPDGKTSASYLKPTAGLIEHRTIYSFSYTADTYYTISVFAKKAELNYLAFRLNSQITTGGTAGWAHYVFDLENGVLGTSTAQEDDRAVNKSIQDVGNGWYRCSVTVYGFGSDQLQIHVMKDNTVNATWDGTGYTDQGIYIYGAQLEQTQSPPSSYIPTSSQQGTREAESFTIPSANLPWPTPQYIGSELVTNGTFDTDSDWTLGSGFTISGGVLTYSATSGVSESAVQDITTEVGKVYRVTYDLVSASGVTSNEVRLEARGGGALITSESIHAYTGSFLFVATDTTTTVNLRSLSTVDGDETVVIDNYSVREINPLSVSIAMDGRITYADTNTTSEATFVGWPATGNQPYIRNFIRTNGSFKGGLVFKQYDGSTASSETEPTPGSYSPDILVPYNIASRHGSTFVNGAVDGVALTADTTPTALPDLSSTDLNLAYDYMGTISEFRVWDKDLGDAGIVEATNPSLEPSLSLTFEGTGTNSFIVNDWSQ